MPVVQSKPDFGPVRISDFKELIAKMQAEMPQMPQRRVYEPVSVTIREKPENLYLAMLAEKAESRATSTSDDTDPIYSYDLNGNRTSMIDPTGITSYTYDALNRLTSVTNNKGFTTSFAYDALGRRTSMTHANGVATTYSYDAASQLLSLVHQLGATTVNSFNYSYDKVGNRKTKADSNGTASYTYDTLNRLIEAINPLPTNPLESFTYDAVGNRVDSNQNGASIFNQANQLTEDASFTYQYDNNGNLTRKTAKVGGQITSYEYDAENKLVRATVNGTTANYKYDGLGRRVEKEVISVSTTVTRYIYDNEDILLELDGSNNIVARYTHGPGIDEPLVMEKGGASFFYHADGLVSITEITDSAGTFKQQYTYSSFGKIESQLDPTFIQPYTFTSREFDSETGLYLNRIRTLDPNTGRFSQEDLFSGFATMPQSLNRYPYVVNNPASWVDPWGLWTFSVGTTVSATGFGGGGGGGTFINVGHNPSSGLLSGWSFSITGTAGIGAIAGLGAGVGLTFSVTNACDVGQLLGTFVEAGRAGLGRGGIAYFQSPDGVIKGGSFTATIGGKGYQGASFGASTTSAIAQWVQGQGLSLGATSQGAIVTVP